MPWGATPNSTKSFGKQVPVVKVSLVLASNGKWLAGRSPGNEIDRANEPLEINLPYVLLNKLPGSLCEFFEILP